MPKLILTIAFAAAMLLAVACAEDEPRAKTTPGAGVTAATSSSSTFSADEAKLRQLISNMEDATFTATYMADGASLGYGDEADAPQIALTLEIAQRGKAYSRTTFTLSGDGMVVSKFAAFHTPRQDALCSDELGALAFFIPLGDKKCFDVGEALAGKDELVSLNAIDSLRKRQFKVLEVSHRAVAGLSATCYRITDAHPEDDADFDPADDPAEREGWLCWSDDDARLMSMEGADGSGKYVLTESGHDVSDDMFELPYPIAVLPTLEIVNDTDVSIFVHASSKESADLIDGQVDVAAHSKGTLRAGLRGTPTKIYLGTYSIPQWHWGCTWDEAKAHEPLVVKDQAALCTNTSLP